MDPQTADIVCLSHLWWDWVWQRPQQLISRLARCHRIFWVEEPHIETGAPWDGFEVREEQPSLHIGRLTYRSDRETFWERLHESRRDLPAYELEVSAQVTEASLMFGSFAQARLEGESRAYVRRWREGRRSPLVLWLYTPQAICFVDLLEPDLVVYDVMDDLSAFRFAPPLLRRQEEELLARADLVFGGGPSLYDAKRALHGDVHLFPSGVDRAHFARALDPDLAVPRELRELPHPVIGFFGVLDERSDLALLAAVADARPEWSWVMVGPVLKVEERDLPRRPNLHYLGKQPYDALPAVLKGFDVAMMPFALNDATRSISPTKTLEYMAAHKPIVSTPIRDVVSLYGSVVRLAVGADAFVRAVEDALAESNEERAARERAEDELLSRHSWDGITAEIDALIEDRLMRKLGRS